MEKPKISIEFNTNELYELLLCITCKSAVVTQRWSTSCSADEEKILNMQQNNLSLLSKKISTAFGDLKKEEETEQDKEAKA